MRGIWKKRMAAASLFIVMLTGCASNGGDASQSAAPAAGQTPAASAEQSPEASPKAPAGKLTDVKVVLDWTPNTNHTGLYVAKEKGFYEEQGLNVQIIQPGAGGTDAMVASNEVPFGVSYQEGLTYARTQDVPLVSIAAIIQHNTSGFAAPVAKNIKSPKDFEGKTYGGFGGPSEAAIIETLMKSEKADPKKVKIINIGSADFFASVKKDIDFSWIYYGWTGVEAELRGEKLDMIYMNKFSDKLDYYTPLLVTNEKVIKEKPEIVKAFMAATAKGYDFAIEKPEEAADILIKAAPDLDPKLVKASQKWLSPKYKEDAPQWGYMKKEVFQGYADWMSEHKLLEKKFEVDQAFTNDFLPGQPKG